jgi:hypothetical protein
LIQDTGDIPGALGLLHAINAVGNDLHPNVAQEHIGLLRRAGADRHRHLEAQAGPSINWRKRKALRRIGVKLRSPTMVLDLLTQGQQ